ncbi:hypothetical protein pb186bvf_020724 [Paramecium bursaria]
MSYITEQHLTSKKKFFCANLNDQYSIDNKTITIKKNSSIPEIHFQTEVVGTTRSQHKAFVINSPKSMDLFNSARRVPSQQSIKPFQSNLKTVPTQCDDNEKKTSKKQNEIKKIIQPLQQQNPQLGIMEYLDYLQIKQSKPKQKQDILTLLTQQEDNFVSFTQMKQNYLKQLKSEHYFNLYKLYYCTHAVRQIVQKQINAQQIVDLYLKRIDSNKTNQFSHVDNLVEEFLSDLDVAQKIFSSSKLMASSLSKIPGIEYKIFHMLFRAKKSLINHAKLTDFIQDDNLLNNYTFTHIDKYDIYLRMLGAGDLPLDYQEHLRSIVDNYEYQPTILSGQFKDKDYRQARNKMDNDFGNMQSWINNIQKVELDLDFIRRLLYYQKKLQATLDQKQTDQLNNKELQLQSLAPKAKVIKSQHKFIERESILQQLEYGEQQLGGFPQVSRANRYYYQNLEKTERVQIRAKANLNF